MIILEIIKWWYLYVFSNFFNNNVLNRFKSTLKYWGVLNLINNRYYANNEFPIFKSLKLFCLLIWGLIKVLPLMLIAITIFLLPVIPIIQFFRYLVI